MNQVINTTVSGQRQLNGPQMSGRAYRNLSAPIHAFLRDDDVAVPMRDGITLLADVYRPASEGRYPVETTYRIPLVPNARRFRAGHQIRLVITSDDQNTQTPAIMGFRRHQHPQHH